MTLAKQKILADYQCRLRRDPTLAGDSRCFEVQTMAERSRSCPACLSRPVNREICCCEQEIVTRLARAESQCDTNDITNATCGVQTRVFDPRKGGSIEEHNPGHRALSHQNKILLVHYQC
jgi:hypothetical protein